MADRSRHLVTASPAPSPDTPPPSCSRTVAGLDYPKGLPWDVADSVVRELLRKPAHADRQKWCQSRPVADKRHSAPLGQPLSVDALLVVQRSSNLPTVGRRP